MTLGKASFWRNKKEAEEFFFREKLGGRRVFSTKKEGEDFFQEKIRGQRLFSTEIKWAKTFFRQISEKFAI